MMVYAAVSTANVLNVAGNFSVNRKMRMHREYVEIYTVQSSCMKKYKIFYTAS